MVVNLRLKKLIYPKDKVQSQDRIFAQRSFLKAPKGGSQQRILGLQANVPPLLFRSDQLILSAREQRFCLPWLKYYPCSLRFHAAREGQSQNTYDFPGHKNLFLLFSKHQLRQKSPRLLLSPSRISIETQQYLNHV